MKRTILILAALALFNGPFARASGLSLGGGSLANQTNFNEVNPTMGNGNNVGPAGNSLTANPPGSYNLLTSAQYSDSYISTTGSISSSMTTQGNPTQIVQSTTIALQAASLNSNWSNESFAASNAFQYFTLTTPYNFQLREQATVSTTSEGATVAGYLTGPSGLVTSWSLSAPAGGASVSTDVTVSGLLEPGSYLLAFGSEEISYSSLDPNVISSANGTGQQTLTFTPTPEPSTLTLLGIGLASMAGYSWRRRKKSGGGVKPGGSDWAFRLLPPHVPIPQSRPVLPGSPSSLALLHVRKKHQCLLGGRGLAGSLSGSLAYSVGSRPPKHARRKASFRADSVSILALLDHTLRLCEQTCPNLIRECFNPCSVGSRPPTFSATPLALSSFGFQSLFCWITPPTGGGWCPTCNTERFQSLFCWITPSDHATGLISPMTK